MSRNILLIGGNTGIGMATARLLVAGGNSVIAAARHAVPLAELGIPSQPFDALAPSPLLLPPVLDGLVYFPGSINLKPFHRLTAEDFLTDYGINCLGAVSAIQSALPALKAAPAASIVLFSTVAVAQGMPFHASIAAAKGAVEGLARSLAADPFVPEHPPTRRRQDTKLSTRAIPKMRFFTSHSFASYYWSNVGFTCKRDRRDCQVQALVMFQLQGSAGRSAALKRIMDGKRRPPDGTRTERSKARMGHRVPTRESPQASTKSLPYRSVFYVQRKPP